MSDDLIFINIYDDMSIEEISNNNNKDACVVITKLDKKNIYKKNLEEVKELIHKNVKKTIELINKNKIKRIIFCKIIIDFKVIFEDIKFLKIIESHVDSIEVKHSNESLFECKEVSNLNIFFKGDKQYSVKKANCKNIKFNLENISNVNFLKGEVININSGLLNIEIERFQEIEKIIFYKCFINDFSISYNNIKEIFLDNACISELRISKTKIDKLLIKYSSITKSFVLEKCDINQIDISSSTDFKGNNFRINNCNIDNAKFESVYFSSATTQFYYDKNIEKRIDNIIFKNCIFNSKKTTFSNGKYNLISFYESIFDTYLHFSPDHVKYVDFDKSINNKVFKFNYNFDSLDIIDFTDFINQGDFIIYGKDYILNTINRENLYNKIINFENHRKLLGIYDDIYEVINNKCNITKYSEEEKKKYTRVNALIAREILNENKMYDIEDYFYSKYHKLEYEEDIVGKIEIRSEAFLKSIFRFFEKRNLLKKLENHVYNISNYGDSYSKIILHMLLFIAKITLLIFLITNYIDSEFLLNNTDKIIANKDIYYFFKIFYFTVITFFTVGYGELTPSGICLQILVGLTAFAGIFFSAYLIAVFTRKMMRK